MQIRVFGDSYLFPRRLGTPYPWAGIGPESLVVGILGMRFNHTSDDTQNRLKQPQPHPCPDKGTHIYTPTATKMNAL